MQLFAFRIGWWGPFEATLGFDQTADSEVLGAAMDSMKGSKLKRGDLSSLIDLSLNG